jgi:predicted ATPase
MRQNGLLRPLRAAELSEGTLRYLLLATALLSPRPPPLMVLNEPETSLHPELLPPLARLIERASGLGQVIVVTHARALAEPLATMRVAAKVVLEKRLGETTLAADDDAAVPSWSWPSR